MENRRISLRDLARMAKVSHATVSLALRNSPDVAAATRERIEQLARACGYQPDPMLRALAEYRRDKTAPPYQSTLAWINYYQNPADADCVGDFRLHREGAEERARELGYKLELFTPCRDRLTAPQLGKILQTRGIQGLLFAPLPKHGKIGILIFPLCRHHIRLFPARTPNPSCRQRPVRGRLARADQAAGGRAAAHRLCHIAGAK